MENINFAPRIEGDFICETNENDEKIVKEIKNLNFISIDAVSGMIFDMGL